MSKKEKKSPRRWTWISILQNLYLTTIFYMDNDLFSYASSCTFGFLFSFIPVLMMILTVLLRVLHLDPQAISDLISSLGVFSQSIDLNSLVSSITNMKTISIFDIVLAFSIIWMARRFFNSVNLSLNRIFRHQMPKQPMLKQSILRQVLTIAGELILVIIGAAAIFCFIAIRTVLGSETILNMLPDFSNFLMKLLSIMSKTLPNVLIFLVSFLCYRFWSRTKPTNFSCLVGASSVTLVFWIFRKFMGLFINVNRYNLVYGVLSSTIVVLLEAYFFFIIFLYAAQDIFTGQFFDTLLLGELYLLPKQEEKGIWSTLTRMLFIRPDYLLHFTENVILKRSGEYIYQKGEANSDAFYIVSGTVRVFTENRTQYLVKGDFFGEEASLFKEVREENARALTDAKLVRISEDTFLELLEKNPKVSLKALSKISNYFARFYGRTEEYPI